MNRRRVAVVHWFPVEYYPPAMNLLRTLADAPGVEVRAYTCHNNRGRGVFDSEGVQVARCHFPDRNVSWFRRLVRYAFFPLLTLLRLLFWWPQVIVYIEPHSALPAFLYCALNRRAQLLIHSHEYHEPREYMQRGMRMVRMNHWLERRYLFQRAEWISQTNRDRVKLFRADHPAVDASKVHELPNLPPASWSRVRNRSWQERRDGESLRLVYVGSLSLRDTFLREIVQWVESQTDVELDIYCYNSDSDTGRYLSELSCDRIGYFSHGVDYDELPELLTRYHVGLILYRGMTQNYVFNASNKLFEYLVVGLDVWYPQQMLGVKPYATFADRPRVIELDFEQLADIDFERYRQRDEQLPWRDQTTCEDALSPLKELILSETSSR
ncbi:hypothetical protein EC9_30780 [Rosistilla ulvae]|uniref:Glycosyltransferase subfamily 4-like N-terminal domain-containing protein n=1 Tax=Rosistilla ulvae TaxID=1930277 RepID=A0A517M1X3_9BACT|nr:glycosyltransferase [Rosistilla ulvae]QDS88883.1 hypothetical protein EC9_30780 [Rosistilla ulvae]